MKLIDKAALVAEIEKLKENARMSYSDYADGRLDVCKEILSFIDTLEVKEGDFGMEVYKYIDEHFNVYDDGNQTLQTKDKKSPIGMVDVENIAKHFFELGMAVSNKAQKGE